MENDRKGILRIIIVVVITAVITFVLTSMLFFGWNVLFPKYELLFDQGSVNIQNIQKFGQVKDILGKYFYQDVDQNVLLEGAAAGMADALKDPYTVYFTKEQMKMFNEEVAGSYVGIGVSITLEEDGLVKIIEPFEGSPAKNAGVLQGDKVLKVDDKDVSMIRDESLIVSLIKGQEGTPVRITFLRPSERKTIEFTMTRKSIKVENMKSQMLPNQIGYIKILKFDAEIANYFTKNLDQLIAQGMKGLIIDVRDNPGGRYDQVVSIADQLLPEGILVYTEDKEKNKRVEKSDKTELLLPIAVLINENSASASEILAGAIKDFKKGTLVGTKTYGKGLVQADFPLQDGSGLKVTIARYFTPSGAFIQGIGIEPDIKVELAEKFKNTPISQVPSAEDVQLKKAIEVVNGKVGK